MIFSTLAGVISPLSNTSKPKRRGTRTKTTLIKSGTSCPRGPVAGPVRKDSNGDITSVINNLAALLPMSMADSLTGYLCFFVQVIISFNLRPDLLFCRMNVFISQFIIQPPCFHIILQLYVQNIFQFLL